MPHGDPADKRIPITEATRQLIIEKKDDKDTYDAYIRELMGVK